MSVTLKDVAKLAQVSKSTVGYVLSGHPKPISEEVRQRVLEAARELGYRPNENARSLVSGRTNVIGVVPFQLQGDVLNSPYVRTALSAIYNRAEHHGRHVLLFTGYDPQDPEAMRTRSFEARVDAVVLIAPKIGAEMMEYLKELQIPMAVIASPVPGSGLHFEADNAAGARQAADHLLDLGHRRIGVVSGPLGERDADERIDAFRARLAEVGVEVQPGHLAYGDFTQAAGYCLGRQMLDGPNRPTAIFAANDQTAYGVMEAARELGLDLPGDLSIVGFDDEDLSSLISPALTTVSQPIREMATAALEAVIAVAEGAEATPLRFETRLVVRASTTSPKEGSHPCNEKHSRSLNS